MSQTAPLAGRTTPLPASSPDHVPPDGSERRGCGVKFPSENHRRLVRPAPRRVPRGLDVDVGRRAMVRLLWAAFPGQSENEVADRASMYLGVSDRTVRNWLSGIHEPRLGHAVRLVGLVGWEAFIGLIEGGE